jgi:hypothetical protein
MIRSGRRIRNFPKLLFIRIAQDLYHIQYVNGDLKGVGLE